MNPKHFVLKGNVIIISSDPPFIEWHIRVKIEDQACHSIDDEMSWNYVYSTFKENVWIKTDKYLDVNDSPFDREHHQHPQSYGQGHPQEHQHLHLHSQEQLHVQNLPQELHQVHDQHQHGFNQLQGQMPHQVHVNSHEHQHQYPPVQPVQQHHQQGVQETSEYFNNSQVFLNYRHFILYVIFVVKWPSIDYNA